MQDNDSKSTVSLSCCCLSFESLVGGRCMKLTKVQGAFDDGLEVET